MTDGFALGPKEGLSTKTGPVERIDKITVKESGGWGFAVETCPAGFQSPLHVHHTEDGAFFILEGSLHLQVGDLEVDATPGTFVFMPRGVAHAFRVTSAQAASYVNVQGPTGDFQELMAETQALMAQALPPAKLAAEQARLAQRHGVEILAPPPRG
jgi:mannose-6-phosphate isomerase-like protein (cupin superfamily)